MPRGHRTVVLLCVAAVALAAFFPGGSPLDYAVLEVHWILIPDAPPIPVPRFTRIGVEQLASLCSLLSSRAPPLSLA
jgi:hypothetical protein